ncbi:Hsp20 family protein [Allosphingosinicella indica]|uniref:Molecular chaperone IbpA n=1 Tax=Allosphingosinicella indica TaxID=941907 RepID=A0A1X7FYD6_9SPHN|nr:Hsp20 family protein [Allosphingosinicella indica]SMF61100.1 molecular chaperone IbpA [Allosphingosinicella indica]
MRNDFDLTAYRRSTIGFDRLFDILEGRMRAEAGDNYPPFDLEKLSDDRYRITLAVAGFGPDDIEIVAKQGELLVTGRKTEDRGNGDYLHRGIAARPFERRFELADFVEVRSAEFANGLLTILLEREIPEAMKPRKIPIAGANPQLSTVEPEREAA